MFIAGRRAEGKRISKLKEVASISSSKISMILDELKGLKNRASMNHNYLSIWHSFNNFLLKLDEQPPHSWESRLALYGVFLVDKGVQSSTLKSYMSAIKGVITTDDENYQWDESSSLIKSCKNLNDRFKTRLPIQIGLLEMILFKMERRFANQRYIEILYKTIFILGHYGLLRVGEITKSDHTIKAKNVFIGMNKDKILLVLYSSKTHNKNSIPQKIKITAVDSTSKFCNWKRHFCPFKLAHQYMNLRGGYQSDTDPFFVFKDGSSVTSCQTNILNKFRSKFIRHTLFESGKKL